MTAPIRLIAPEKYVEIIIRMIGMAYRRLAVVNASHVSSQFVARLKTYQTRTSEPTSETAPPIVIRRTGASSTFSMPAAAADGVPQILQEVVVEILVAASGVFREHRFLQHGHRSLEHVGWQLRCGGRDGAVHADEEGQRREQLRHVGAERLIAGIDVRCREVDERHLVTVDHHVRRIECTVSQTSTLESSDMGPQLAEDSVGDVGLVGQSHAVGERRGEHRGFVGGPQHGDRRRGRRDRTEDAHRQCLVIHSSAR